MYKKLLLATLLILAGAFISSFIVKQVSAAGKEIYVDFNSGSGGNGSSAQPYNTLLAATSAAAAGDTILIKPGTYSLNTTQVENNSYLTINGFKPAKASCDDLSSSKMLTIKPAPGGNVVLQASQNFGWRQFMRINDVRCIHFDGDNRLTIDGNEKAFDDNISMVYISQSENVIFENTIVRDGGGRGISFYNTNNGRDDIYIRNNEVTGIHYRSIGGYGDYVYIDGNNVHGNALANVNGKIAGSGWPGVIQTTNDFETYKYATNIFVRNNYIHDNWGEGIITNFVDGIEITGNTVANNYSINIYLDNGTNIKVSGNYVYNDTNAFNRPDRPNNTASGITWSAEDYSNYPPNVKPENITIENNLMVGGRYGISYIHAWRSTSKPLNSYKNVKIINNTIKDSEIMPILMEKTKTSADLPENNIIRNNVFFKTPAANCNNYDSGMTGNFDSYCIGTRDFPSWTIDNNYWVERNNSNNPQLTGSDLTPGVNPTNFIPKSGSPLIRAGVNVGLGYDYYNASRTVSSPTLGFAEPGNDSSSASSTSSSGSCAGDYDNSGQIDVKDLSVFASNYNVNDINCNLDLAGNNCYLDTADLSVFVSRYKVPGICG